MNKKFVQSLILSIVLSLLFTGVALLITKHFSGACCSDQDNPEPIDEDTEEGSES